MISFVLLAYTGLAALRTLLQQLLACLNFTLESEDLCFWCKQKSDFYELWRRPGHEWREIHLQTSYFL